MKQLCCLCPGVTSTRPPAGRCGLALPVLWDQPKATHKCYLAVCVGCLQLCSFLQRTQGLNPWSNPRFDTSNRSVLSQWYSCVRRPHHWRSEWVNRSFEGDFRADSFHLGGRNWHVAEGTASGPAVDVWFLPKDRKGWWITDWRLMEKVHNWKYTLRVTSSWKSCTADITKEEGINTVNWWFVTNRGKKTRRH